MSIVLVGISHHQAPVELRERAALNRQRAAELAQTLAGGRSEAVCLSTCNRTELYLADESADAAEEKAEAALLALESKLGPALYRLRDEEAALHLFRVAAGLDSMIPGEGEILGQVRAAHEAGATGPLLDRLFRQAVQAGRKVRAQTAIGESPASVSSAAAALAEQVYGELDGCSILLIGAGKISEQAARNLRSRGARIAFVANRTRDRGDELAERLGAEAIPAVEAEKFREWQASLDVVPAIASLRARAEQIRDAELRKAEAVLGRLDDSERRAVESITAQIVNKLLHLPTVRMKQAAV